jgi:hypothetical protein
MRLNPEEIANLARMLKEDDPSWTPERIAQALAGLLASTAAQRLQWSKESREKEAAARQAYQQQKASQPKIINIPPDPLPTKDEDLTYKPPQPKPIEWTEKLEQQAMEIAKEDLRRTYVPIWKRNQ